jgi:hypothetical protein
LTLPARRSSRCTSGATARSKCKTSDCLLIGVGRVNWLDRRSSDDLGPTPDVTDVDHPAAARNSSVVPLVHATRPIPAGLRTSSSSARRRLCGASSCNVSFFRVVELFNAVRPISSLTSSERSTPVRRRISIIRTFNERSGLEAVLPRDSGVPRIGVRSTTDDESARRVRSRRRIESGLGPVVTHKEMRRGRAAGHWHYAPDDDQGPSP